MRLSPWSLGKKSTTYSFFYRVEAENRTLRARPSSRMNESAFSLFGGNSGGEARVVPRL